MRAHNPNSYIHKTAEKVIQHLVDEDGICNHTGVALGAMFGVSEQTIYVVRVHLETCPMSGNYRLPYRARGPLVLTDPDKNLTTLEAAAVRAEPVMKAATSVMQSITRMPGLASQPTKDMKPRTKAGAPSGHNDPNETVSPLSR